MRYGFAIDQRTCIGCHACTVACKTEHEIPVGQFRTWIKYVETGTFPDTARKFGVLRCNHCTDAPCVSICPTGSLFKRDDGIVDFDSTRCIGCKACMQACPYDAIYIDEDSHTAAKCNFCAHRVDSGLEPACVVVCPTHSIWVGDLDDETSGIARLINDNPTAVRAPEQNTGPNVFYLGADRAVLDPVEAPVDESYIWSRPDAQRVSVAGALAEESDTGARTTLNTAHPRPWGWRVTTYLWAKGVGGGAVLLAALGSVLGIHLGTLGMVAAPAIGLAGAVATMVLLIWDLKRPARFLYILLEPNPTSWVMWGAVALSAFAAISGLWLIFGALDVAGALPGGAGHAVVEVLRWPAIPAGALTACYTGWLFGQAEGRDLWQSRQLVWHLIAQAVMAGAGALAACAPVLSTPSSAQAFVVRAFVLGTAAYLVMLGTEYAAPHATRNAQVAARMITHGRYARLFWGGAVGLAIVALALGAAAWSGGAVAAALAGGTVAQVALLGYESVFVRAGQDVPLS